MSLAEYDGKRFSLWLTDDKDEDVVFSGWIAKLSDETLLLTKEAGQILFEPAWLDRIRAVESDEVRQILLGADYFLQLRVGMMSDGDHGVPTGMRWPD